MNYFKVQANGLEPRFFFFESLPTRQLAELAALAAAADTRGEICVWATYLGNVYRVIGEYPAPEEWVGPTLVGGVQRGLASVEASWAALLECGHTGYYTAKPGAEEACALCCLRAAALDRDAPEG